MKRHWSSRRVIQITFFLIIIILLVAISIFDHYSNPNDSGILCRWRNEVSGRKMSAPIKNIYNQYEEGRHTFEEPYLLPNLKLITTKYSPEQLETKYNNISFIYSFANGTEFNHVYRRAFSADCAASIQQRENESYTGVLRVENTTVDCWPSMLLFATKVSPYESRKAKGRGVSGFELLSNIRKKAEAVSRDRETDELRYSLRSLEANVPWHRGILACVSPGHHPEWMDAARNFMSSACARKSYHDGRHLRLTTIHQDAILPYGLRLTRSNYAVEDFLWRVKNITSIHIYFNDDYFVNQPVKVSDFVNPYGGTIIRVEKGVIHTGKYPKNAKDNSWANGVLRTNAFNIVELDERREDYLDPNLIRELEHRGLINSDEMRVHPDWYLDWSLQTSPELIADLKAVLIPRRHRRYGTHAPFAYCTGMFRALSERYVMELSNDLFKHRERMAWGYIPPFLHQAFMMARPWIASPKFFLYLYHIVKHNGTASHPALSIHLDNEDGCAPATLLGGIKSSRCLFAKFQNNETKNKATIASVFNENPLFFNINGGFTSKAADEQLKRFLELKFPASTYLEGNSTNVNEEEDNALRRVFWELMELPVVMVTKYEEGVCANVRSLQVALREHRGPLHVFSEAGEQGSLKKVRRQLGHDFCSGLPSVRCVFNENVTVHRTAPFDLWSSLSGVLRTAGVKIPKQCGGWGGVEVHGIVVDTRSASTDISKDSGENGWKTRLREAVAVPGQTLALEDFEVVELGSDVRVLHLSRSTASQQNVHWITGGCEADLLQSFPLPVERTENLSTIVEFLFSS